MDRRGFLKFFSAGVAGIALEQAIPLGRVWSFPKEIVIAGQIHLPRWVELEKLKQRTNDPLVRVYKIHEGLGYEPEFGEVMRHSEYTRRFTAAFPPDSSHIL